MDAALRAFLAGLVDYAGLFPPAKLDMEPAIRNHLAYRAGADRFMLGRFICPAGRLEELGSCLGEDPDDPVDLSVIVRGDALESDLETAREFAARAPVTVGAFEIRAAGDVAAFASEADARMHESGFGGVPMWLEVGWPDAGFREVAVGLRAARDDGIDANLKIRTGGLEAAAFPSVEAVADAIAAARDEAIPFKATAGLHHPVRRLDESVETRMHGFLNVFGAAILADVCGIGGAELLGILGEEDPAAFRLSAGRFGWRDLDVTAEEIAGSRESFAASFGSCSFDEPREDLRSLGMMP